MHTKDFLAEELEKVGLREMAMKARTGYYHDYLSPLAMPEMQLLADLDVAGKVAKSFNNEPRAAAIEELRRRHMDGEFDASKEESDAWAASAEGQETFRKLKGPL